MAPVHCRICATGQYHGMWVKKKNTTLNRIPQINSKETKTQAICVCLFHLVSHYVLLIKASLSGDVNMTVCVILLLVILNVRGVHTFIRIQDSEDASFFSLNFFNFSGKSLTSDIVVFLYDQHSFVRRRRFCSGLSPILRQVTILTNAGLLLIGNLRTAFSKMGIKMQQFSYK